MRQTFFQRILAILLLNIKTRLAFLTYTTFCCILSITLIVVSEGVIVMPELINLEDWYNAFDAAERLTANSGRPIDVSYVRTLARYGKITHMKLGTHAVLYLKKDVDAYIVEERGEKTARLNRQKALERKSKKKGTEHTAA